MNINQLLSLMTNDHEEQELYEELLNSIGVIHRFNGIIPNEIFCMMMQLNTLSPHNLDMSRATPAQMDAFSKLRYDTDGKSWLLKDEFNNSEVFFQQVDKITLVLDINKWLVIYSFIINNYDVEATKAFCLTSINDKFGTLDRLLNADDSNGCGIILNYLQKTNIPQYKLPIESETDYTAYAYNIFD